MDDASKTYECDHCQTVATTAKDIDGWHHCHAVTDKAMDYTIAMGAVLSGEPMLDESRALFCGGRWRLV
jgi:hypothetical protein